ncbi:MAG: hypothetical protein V7754_12175 [Halioglobus sp.]
MPKALLPLFFITLFFCLGTAHATTPPPKPTANSASTTTNTAQASRFKRTAQALNENPNTPLTLFANIALSELIQIYLAEADLARNEAHERDNNQKLMRWAQAVDQFSSQLLLVLDDVDDGFPISLSVAATGPVGLTVADRIILLTHPRADQQRAYEQRVLSDFCSREKCLALLEPAESLAPIPVTTPYEQAQWSFSETGPQCHSNSVAIQVRFANARQLPRLRALCTQLFFEVASLVAEIRWQMRHGVVVDWAVLSLTPTPGQPQHLLTLNSSGDSALLSLPLLYGTQGLLAILNNWLPAEVASGEQEILLLDGAELQWDLDVQPPR